jgi:Tol biopolymer transport system component
VRAERRLLGVGMVVALVAGAVLVVASPASATFPGRNGKIVFASAISGHNQIYVMEPDGSDVTQLTNGPADDRGPAWSADGKRIVFVRRPAVKGATDDIWVMNADGTGQTQLTNTPSANDRSPHFSPDGDKIVFGSSDGVTDWEIYEMNVDGSNVRQLTHNTVDDLGPRFSPDGKKIVFSSGNPASNIWVMDADGSNPRNLTNNPANEFAGDFSPDGEKILFGRAVSGIGSAYDVFVMNSDGSDQRDLTNAPGGDFGARFSPDGERIVFTSDRTGPNNVFVMNADGSDQTDITNHAQSDLGPDWQPRSVDGDVTVTKSVVGTAPAGATYDVKVVCDNGDDQFSKTLTFGEAGGTQSFERESFGPLECEVTEPNSGGASTTSITCANAKNAECKQNGKFDLFDDPGGDKTKIEIDVTNTFPVTAEPTFTG